MMGTLTSNISNSEHTSTSPIIVYKLYSVATVKHSEPLPLENQVRIATLTPDLRRVSFYSMTDFLRHSSTTELPTIPDTHKDPIQALGRTPIQEVITSFVAIVAHTFNHDRHADLYLGLRRLILSRGYNSNQMAQEMRVSLSCLASTRAKS